MSSTRIEPLPATGLTIQGDHDMAKLGSEMVGERGESHLRTAHREGREHMHHQRRRNQALAAGRGARAVAASASVGGWVATLMDYRRDLASL